MSTCPRCENARVVYSRRLARKIRCPQCTHRKPDRTGKHLRTLSESSKRNLSAAEVQRFARTIEQDVAHALINKLGIPGVPEHLATTDRILQRWAAAPSGMPSENEDVYHVSRPPPLDPKTQEAVSDVVKAAPFGVRSFCGDWYLHPVPPDIMAERMQMSRRQLGREWQRALVDLRARFLKSPHPDLRHMVSVLP